MKELGLSSWWGQKPPAFARRVRLEPPDWSERSLIVRATLDRLTVGRCDCMLDEKAGALRIEMLQVYDIHEARRFQWLGCLRPPSTRGVRGLGIGRLVLEAVVAEAGRVGVRRLHGVIVRDHLRASSWLEGFYEDVGFTVAPASEADFSGAVLKIELRYPSG